MRASEERTAGNSRLQLNIAVNYGGRWDIVNACRSLVLANVRAEKISELDFAQHLSLGNFPEPDLFIRTGGEQRISNYLLWQLAYTEMFFTDTHWPDFSTDKLAEACEWYADRQRRFGRTSEQLKR